MKGLQPTSLSKKKRGKSTRARNFFDLVVEEHVEELSDGNDSDDLCYVSKTVEVIKKLKNELHWFEKNPQFRHFFHMPKEPNLKLHAWFPVNGVPILYSMREHALISRLECREYPVNYEKLGSFEFVDRDFKSHGDQLKMAVFFFLGTVIRGNGKYNGRIDSFILRVVNDLDVCETFPWGRLTFEDAIHSINHVLIFESIPALNAKFREGVDGCLCSCPRMCKRRFQSNSMKGYPLEELYDALGNTQEIKSYLVPTVDEAPLMAQTEKPIWWKELYELDVATREFPKKKDKEKVNEEAVSFDNGLEGVLKGLEERTMNVMREVSVKMETMDKWLDGIEKSQRVLNEKCRKQEIVETKLDAIEKSQVLMKRKVRKMTKQLKEKDSFNNEGFENQGMDFDSEYHRNEVDEEGKQAGEEAQTDQEEKEKEGEEEKDKEQDDETEGIDVQEEGAQFEAEKLEEDIEAEKDAETEAEAEKEKETEKEEEKEAEEIEAEKLEEEIEAEA
ncbi:hypothetical protein N665_0041s0020 [Sinapis alba]|nr:hypothetical protein N665_0041s0020 [Sinapis alba]